MGTTVNLDLFFHRVKNRFISRQSWIVLCRPLDTFEGLKAVGGIEVRAAREDELDMVAKALPDELAGRLSHDKRLLLVRSRFSSGIPCVVAVQADTGRIIGGCWCRSLTPGNPLRRLLPE